MKGGHTMGVVGLTGVHALLAPEYKINGMTLTPVKGKS